MKNSSDLFTESLSFGWSTRGIIEKKSYVLKGG